jgi:rfaE bifunctional protein nucleotidyltransferase chain/domain
MTLRCPAPPFERKLCPPEDFVKRAHNLPVPRVFTNGVFDIIHRGHATYLAQARALGGSLVVAVNSDDSARRLGKGPDRPINALPDRVALVAAFESVDLVTWFAEDTPLRLILACRPDVLVKGGDWQIGEIVGAQEVLAWGGQVHAITFDHDVSTTRLLDRIRSSRP